MRTAPFRKLTRALLLVAGLVAAGGVAWATIFRLDPDPPRSSPKVGRITPDDMVNSCAFEQQDTPFFTDAEYRNAIAEYEREIGKTQVGDPNLERLSGLREALKECRENDRNKRHAQKASRSCKDLVKEHRTAQEAAWNAVEWANVPFKRDIVSWGDRFKPALEKCMKRMRCRLDSKKDMQEALDVYREFRNNLFNMSGFKSMKICGVTIRDLERWCSTDVGENTVADVCFDTDMIRIALTQLSPYEFPPYIFGGDSGGAVGGNAP